MTRNRCRPVLAVTAALSVLVAAGCAPGSGSADRPAQPGPSAEVTTDASALGDVTLTVWDQEVRGGQAAQIKQLNQEFQEKYPNITIKRVSRSFDDLKTTLRLALTGDNAPDVVQANNGRSDMGAFVEGDLLLPLDAYAEAYGWKDRYPESVLAYSSYSPDGATFGTGSLFGLPQMGEVIGIFYNKATLDRLGIAAPQTWEEFEAALASAKKAGEVPIQFGNLDQWPGIHVYGTVQSRFVPADEIRDLGFGRPGASWTTPENLEAARAAVDWVDKGYFTPDFNGVGYDPSWQAFGKGEGVFLISGTWLLADLQKALGKDLGFMLPPPRNGQPPMATGGTGLPFAITAQSPNAAAAAAYIDFITNEHAMTVITETGNLPVVDAGKQEVPAGPQQDVFSAWSTVTSEDGLLPYLDYATPTFYDTLTAAVQNLLATKSSPEQFLDTLEKEYVDFTDNAGG